MAFQAVTPFGSFAAFAMVFFPPGFPVYVKER
jgi:hypothetical protein